LSPISIIYLGTEAPGFNGSPRHRHLPQVATSRYTRH